MSTIKTGKFRDIGFFKNFRLIFQCVEPQNVWVNVFLPELLTFRAKWKYFKTFSASSAHSYETHLG